ncbi:MULTISPECIES: capsule biosynthesis protein [unclassified Pasteurella]|uniref:capsule biosynthesis protein n=1 Tax=unclassified Pasteurella TaxID=2621516 RepID=UPI0010744BF1|nr:capsule biosynthesis protein [Pasteurella sp. 19428wF3_WM03]TFU49982.1 capsule biosynthesis protein [Pasteurella sp. WM03]
MVQNNKLAKKRPLFKRIKPLLWITVIIPTFFSALYFILFAADVYISESSFVVRSPRNQAALSGVGALLQNTGFARAQDDTYSVQEYIRSRTALEQLQQQLPIRGYYENNGDLLSRFNAFGINDSQEAFYRYFKERLTVDFDSISGIATLRVRAFAAEEGQKINIELLKQGEDLINRLNERARKDTLNYAEQAVVDAEKMANDSADALSQYRIQHKIYDLPAQSGVQVSLISTLKSEIIKVETQLAQLQSITPDNPQVAALKMRQKSLTEEMTQQIKLLAGSNDSLVTQSPEYQRLLMSNELAQQMLATAITSLQNARNEADRQQLYLEIINQPSKPDWALEPYRLYNILATLIIGLMLYGLLSLIIAGIKEHKN